MTDTEKKEKGVHVTVLLEEAVQGLLTDKSGFYIDGTFGRGGHSGLVLEGLSEAGCLLSIDKDPQAIAVGNLQFGKDSRFELVQESFADMRALVESRNKLGEVAGILLDLGVSSPQLDQAERGFSFSHDGPLDMRMDDSAGITAAQWVNSASESEIVRVLKEYGEERFARRMARAILQERAAEPITTTSRLAKIIAAAHPAWERGKNPATKAFQGIRIHINDELKDLEQVLDDTLDMLAVGGRLVVISFHSLEDRRVKRFIQRHVKGDDLPAGLPVTADKLNKRLKLVGKMIKAGEQELEVNPRARSAVMRVAEKIA
jgi:16S rRNA (cytosine1402-N4)-methyltransferase